MAFFKKKKEANSNKNFGLEIGSDFEHDQKIWTVKKIFEYDWGEYKSLEYEVECFGEKAFLEIEQDDEMYMTFTREIDFYTLDQELAERINSNNIPKKISYNDKKFIFDEDSEGTCLDLQKGEKDKVYCIDFYDKNDEYLVSIEQWGKDEFTASFGKRVREHEFNFHDNTNTGNRFA